MALLAVDGLTKSFGGLQANSDISFKVEEGELVGVIGPNGAGKTTAFNQISGFMRPDAGCVTLAGRDITGLRADRVCKAGLARTFQVVRVFSKLTVRHNVLAAAMLRHHRARDAERAAMEVMERLGLEGVSRTRCEELTLASRKRVELARALATQPRVLLLDEVMSGLTPTETKEAVELLESLRSEVTMVIIEHVMEIIMPLSDRVIVFVDGKKYVEGSPAEISRNAGVISAYLGEKFDAHSQ